MYHIPKPRRGHHHDRRALLSLPTQGIDPTRSESTASSSLTPTSEKSGEPDRPLPCRQALRTQGELLFRPVCSAYSIAPRSIALSSTCTHRRSTLPPGTLWWPLGSSSATFRTAVSHWFEWNHLAVLSTSGTMALSLISPRLSCLVPRPRFGLGQWPTWLLTWSGPTGHWRVARLVSVQIVLTINSNSRKYT
jgi:hypothetical protein